MVDVVVAGGGPAGLNAALMLGRAQRETLVCDAGTPRNQLVAAMHGFLSRDGFDPAELRRVGRQQLEQYGTVSVVDVGIEQAHVDGDGFTVRLADGTDVSTRRLLLATGVVDELRRSRGWRSVGGGACSTAPTVTGGSFGVSRWPCSAAIP
jgi:thioredoxin reductase